MLTITVVLIARAGGVGRVAGANQVLDVLKRLAGSRRQHQEQQQRGDATDPTHIYHSSTVKNGRTSRSSAARKRRLALAGAAALILVIGLLALCLGRLRDVVVVLATVPIALVGGLVALRITGDTWNASSIVGAIGLFGVAVQNALVLTTQTRTLVAEGLAYGLALREAAVGRLRPKLMTAGASILGLAPMLFGIGGSELERPLAAVMVGGLVTSTLFTLLVLPAVQLMVAGDSTSKP